MGKGRKKIFFTVKLDKKGEKLVNNVIEQVRKLSRCDSYFQNLKTLPTHPIRTLSTFLLGTYPKVQPIFTNSVQAALLILYWAC